jgi:catechol 2,3-dioxygenase-like lactoylglutathione lyase family enzyme
VTWNPFPMMFHPTVLVDDLESTSAWFRRVFGRREVTWGEKWNLEWLNPTYPIDYSYFFVVGDVSVDALCPRLLTLDGDAAAVYPEKQGLTDIAWFVNDIEDVARSLERGGFRTRDQVGNVIHDGAVPESGLLADCPMIWSLPEDTGLTYEFYTMGSRHWPKYSRRADPRLDPDWVPDRVAEGDPLGVVRAAHHTIATLDPDRAHRLFVDVLGATVAGRGHDDARQETYVDIAYAKSVLHFVTPDGDLPGTPSDRRATGDQYTGITLDVVDVDAVERHLAEQGVPTQRVGDEVTTDPASSLGIAWGFRPVP